MREAAAVNVNKNNAGFFCHFVMHRILIIGGENEAYPSHKMSNVALAEIIATEFSQWGSRSVCLCL